MINLKLFWWKLRKKMGSPRLLCDSCMYDHHSACDNARRPNATACAEYRKR